MVRRLQTTDKRENLHTTARETSRKWSAAVVMRLPGWKAGLKA
jgi:hypothetical protein